jgi:hypothetical protein
MSTQAITPKLPIGLSWRAKRGHLNITMSCTQRWFYRQFWDKWNTSFHLILHRICADVQGSILDRSDMKLSCGNGRSRQFGMRLQYDEILDLMIKQCVCD